MGGNFCEKSQVDIRPQEVMEMVRTPASRNSPPFLVGRMFLSWFKPAKCASGQAGMRDEISESACTGFLCTLNLVLILVRKRNTYKILAKQTPIFINPKC